MLRIDLQMFGGRGSASATNAGGGRITSREQFYKKIDTVSEQRFDAEQAVNLMYHNHPDLSDGQVQALSEFKKKARRFKRLDKEFNRLLNLGAAKGWA